MLRLVQRTGQKAFQTAEGLFNRVFGDALNPFYYLGAIAYYLLWVVVASGLYLYIFFKTGVREAYDSVEYLTHDQWWLGGILRSFHRYASDAMVLAMVLHLIRHFTFDQYRSFRWFSWVSGVILLWLVYISGINGYMLPWDSTAQFVTVATAEWLDWLPVFKGALIRNFITPDAVNDRLFSLLSFLHIGLPLGVLGLLWIHTQRVPGARTHPPRPIWIGVTLALLARVAGEAGTVRASRRPRRRADHGSLRLVLPDRLPADLLVVAGRGLGTRRRPDAAARAAALDAAEAHVEGGPAPDGAARQPDHSGASRRVDPRGRAARRDRVPLRVPQRRLRPVQVHGALRPGRAGSAPGVRALRGRARRGPRAGVQRDPPRRHRDRVRAEGDAGRNRSARSTRPG